MKSVFRSCTIGKSFKFKWILQNRIIWGGGGLRPGNDTASTRHILSLPLSEVPRQVIVCMQIKHLSKLTKTNTKLDRRPNRYVDYVQMLTFKTSSETRLVDLLDFGQLFKARIILPKLPTFLGNFGKVVKIFHFASEIIFGQLLQAFATFWSH